MQRARQVIVLVITTLVTPLPTSATTVDFAASGFNVLPYSENGLTFSTMPGTNSAYVANGHLGSGTNFIPIHIRATGIQPFDLMSINVGNFYRTWRIESSSGAVMPLLSPGTIDFSGQTGWSSIVYFDFIHNPAEPNGAIQVNSLEFQVGPNSLPGDFNDDGFVDAADYTVWRKTISTQAGYNAWRSHFGQPPGSGSRATTNAAVPEPATLMLLVSTLAGGGLRRRQPHESSQQPINV